MKDPYDDAVPLNWKKYLLASGQFLLIFYVATFVLAYYLLHYAHGKLFWTVFLVISYVLVVVLSGVRLVRKLSMSALMIAAPTIPLCMMILVVSLLPVFQMLDKYERGSEQKISVRPK